MEEIKTEQAIITTIRDGEESREGVYASFDQENCMIYLYKKEHAQLWYKVINPRSSSFVSMVFERWSNE